MGRSDPFTIRNLTTYEEFLQVHRIQQAVWGFEKPGTGLYPPFLLTASRNGGVVLGAFDPSGQMVGYIFGFLGREAKGPLKLCSQTMGVLQEWRGQGVATALKWAQREQTLAADLSLITWTFDPLESANARINMHKLGAIGRRYWRNIYGEHFGALNQGLPTDRLLVEWWIQGRRVQATQQGSRVRDQDAVAVFEVEAPGLSKRVRAFHDDLNAPHLSLEVPADIQRLKRTDLSLAREWRMCVRDAFEKYFASGYVVVDFLAEGQGETRRNHYVLARLTDDLRDWIGIGQS